MSVATIKNTFTRWRRGNGEIVEWSVWDLINSGTPLDDDCSVDYVPHDPEKRLGDELELVDEFLVTRVESFEAECDPTRAHEVHFEVDGWYWYDISGIPHGPYPLQDAAEEKLELYDERRRKK